MSTVNQLHQRTSISLSKENYDKLKRFGFAGESLNDALGRILDQVTEENR
jgi:hypothetical protein